MKGSLINVFRMMPWLLAALVCTVVVGVIAPHQLGVLAWSLSKLCLGAYLGYWIDRSVFYYARPGDIRVGSVNSLPLALVVAVAMLRRALIMTAAIIALGLGV